MMPQTSTATPAEAGLRAVVLGLVAMTATVLAAPLVAQGERAPPGFVAEFEGQFEASASKLVALAEAMPASTYEWSPGEDVASVARVYMHIAHYNYMYPHENMRRDTPVPPAEYERWETDVHEKAEVVRRLRASMDYVRGVAAGMSAVQLNQTTSLYGRDVGEWAVLFQLITHMNEHLGQSIAYARMNGVVPPWSR
jgi:uncharacterized damage-inducible protein DinB